MSFEASNQVFLSPNIYFFLTYEDFENIMLLYHFVHIFLICSFGNKIKVVLNPDLSSAVEKQLSFFKNRFLLS